jgi:hypothetical protein
VSLRAPEFSSDVRDGQHYVFSHHHRSSPGCDCSLLAQFGAWL